MYLSAYKRLLAFMARFHEKRIGKGLWQRHWSLINTSRIPVENLEILSNIAGIYFSLAMTR